MAEGALGQEIPLRRAACRSKVSAIQEFNMSHSLSSLIHATAGAARAAQLRGQVIAAVGFYFGYWFSHRRA